MWSLILQPAFLPWQKNSGLSILRAWAERFEAYLPIEVSLRVPGFLFRLAHRPDIIHRGRSVSQFPSGQRHTIMRRWRRRCWWWKSAKHRSISLSLEFPAAVICTNLREARGITDKGLRRISAALMDSWAKDRMPKKAFPAQAILRLTHFLLHFLRHIIDHIS